MRLATTDEDRRPAIAVTGRTAALLPTELLAGARHIAAFAGGTGRTTALFELPGHDAVQDVGAGVDTEDIVVQIDFGAGFTGALDRTTVVWGTMWSVRLDLGCPRYL